MTSSSPATTTTTTIDAPDPVAQGGHLPPNPPPAVSVKTLAVTGILVDVFGLEELPAAADLTHVSVLWLHSARRMSDRTGMAPLARRAVGGYNAGRKGRGRGLIAVAFGAYDLGFFWRAKGCVCVCVHGDMNLSLESKVSHSTAHMTL